VRPPPVLKPPPSMALPAVCGVGSTWDILRSFAPDEKEDAPAIRSGRRFGHRDAVEKDDDEDGAVLLMLDDLGLEESSEGFTGTSSLSTTNDDETSSTTTESMFYISPNGIVLDEAIQHLSFFFSQYAIGGTSNYLPLLRRPPL